VEFESALDALRCAEEIQSYLHNYNVSSKDEWKIRVRIGIHLGDVIHQANDILGDAVNIASRIEPIADPEGICVSDQVFGQVRNKVSQPLVKLVPRDLKNVRFPVDVYKVVMPWEKVALPDVSYGAARSQRIAVLPFANMSPDPEDEYFADGMTEEVISTLSKVRDFEVISRTSVMQYKKTPKPIKEVSMDLNAGTILEGSVRKADHTLRITVQMIDATSDRHIWVQSYDRDFRDVFAIQGDIANNVAEVLKTKLGASERKGIGKVLTENTEAYTLYLKGAYYMNRFKLTNGFDKAIEYFQLACEQDPEFALAYARLAECYVLVADMSMPSAEAIPSARKFLACALSLDVSLAEAHSVRALIANQYDWDWEVTEKSYREALSLNPSLVQAHIYYGWFLAMMGRLDEAVTESALAYNLDPKSPFTVSFCGFLLWIAGKNDGARELCRKALELEANHYTTYETLSLLSATESKWAEAIEEADTAVKIVDEAASREFQAIAYAMAGQKEKARILDGLLSKKFKGYASPGIVGIIYYTLGDKDNGFRWMQKAYDDRDTFLPMWTPCAPIAKVAREDPRFRELLHRMKLS
jgi:TolB-like protein/Tfp pilus assembly protein PilF